MSILRLDAASPARSARSSSSTRSTRRSRSATGSAWSGRTAPARRRSCGSPPAATSRIAATVQRKRGLSIGLLAQEAHFDAAFMAAPDLRTAVRTGAAHLERDGRRAGRARARRPGRRSRRYADLQHRFEVLGGYTLDQRVDAALSRPRLRPRRVGQAADARCPAASRRGPRSPGSSSPIPDLLLLDEPTNHLDLDALEWLEEHLRRRARLAARRLARPGLPRRDGDPDLGAARPPPDGVPRRLQRVPPPARGARRAGGQGRRHAGRADRARAGARPALPEPPQVQQDARARGAARAAPGRATRGAAKPVAGCACRRRRWPAAGPSRSGEIVVRVEDLVVGYLPGRGARRRRRRAGDRAARRRARARSSPPSAATGSGSSGRTARARRRCCGRSPASCRRSTATLDVRATPSSSATSPSSAARRSRARPCSTRCSRRSRSRRARRAATSPASCSAATTCSRRSARCPAASGRGSSSRCSGSMPSNLLLLDEPTNHLDIPAREAIEAFMRESPATLLVVSPRPAPARDGLRPAVGRRRRAGRRRSTAATGRGGRPSPTAGRSAARSSGGATPAARPAATASTGAGIARRRAERRRRRRRRGSRDRLAAPAATPRVEATAATAREAVEGRLPAPEGGARCRADPARPAQEPPRAGDGRPGRRRQLRRAAAGHERAGRRRAGARRGRGRLARARGARAVTTPRRPDRPDRADRLRQVDRRRLARRARGVVVIDADAVARDVLDAGRAGTSRRSYARFGPALARPDGALDRAALGRIVFADPAALARSRGDRPPGRPAADPRRRSTAAADAARPSRRHRGDQARRGRARRRCATRSGS